jgi:hypothetical protein
MKRFFLLVLAAVAVSACGTSRRVTAETAHPWVGFTTEEILLQMGDPTRIDIPKLGGSVLVYEFTPDYNSPDYDLLGGEGTAREQEYAHFYLDEEGYCYRVDTNRNLPVPPNPYPSGVRRAFWLDVLIWAPILLLTWIL